MEGGVNGGVEGEAEGVSVVKGAAGWGEGRTCLTIICQINVMRLKPLVNLLGLLVQCYYHKLTLRYNLLFKVGCNCMFHDVFITDYEAKKKYFPAASGFF